MKKFVTIALLVSMSAALLAGCGKTYTCRKCKKTTTKAYYTIAHEDDDVLCADCADEYWLHLNIEAFRVK